MRGEGCDRKKEKFSETNVPTHERSGVSEVPIVMGTGLRKGGGDAV